MHVVACIVVHPQVDGAWNLGLTINTVLMRKYIVMYVGVNTPVGPIWVQFGYHLGPTCVELVVNLADVGKSGARIEPNGVAAFGPMSCDPHCPVLLL